jgi:uncharacterized protein (DUF2267 family)
MRAEEFVEEVQKRIPHLSAEQALKAVEAVLETLGERLKATERRHVAAQLPKELKEHILRPRETTDFTLQEFYTRVGARSSVRFRHAVGHTQAVMSVLKQAVAEGELKDAFGSLPEEFARLLEE